MNKSTNSQTASAADVRPREISFSDRLVGVLLGTAVGDALGLPAEGISRHRIARLWKGDWRMRLAFGKGMISDDTEHTLMVAQALAAHPNDAVAFQRSLAWKLRWWFASLPAGMGLATARACVKLWIGFPPGKSAVASAGSGTAMRSAILGAFFATNEITRREYVLASARLTHRSWQAEVAALAVAESAANAISAQTRDPLTIIHSLASLSNEGEWQKILSEMREALSAGQSVGEFALRLNLNKGVSGYALHVVPVALYAWLRHPGDFRLALTSALDCGGDTDTVGAIVGALVGASVGARGIPNDWIQDLCEWPRSIGYMQRLAAQLAEVHGLNGPGAKVAYFWPGILLRNILFLGIVLFHGLRRLAPPY
jgi:ADP-ribosylglycohydrolase